MSNNGIIKNTVIDVAQRVIKQESKTNKKLDNVLNKKFEKVDQDKARYIDILKYNVLFYKTLSRNMEPLIGKWILEKNIPDLSELQDDIELMNARCRKYINNAKANGIDGLKEADVQSFTYYDKMGSSDCIKRLQKDYKVLNIYIEVLSMTLKELSYKKEESVEIFLMNPSEAKMELKREIIVIVNRILAGGSKENEETPVDEAFMKRIKMITDAEITEASNDELKRVLELEKLSEEEAFGVSGKYAYVFAAATVLLEFIKDKKKAVIEGAMRLTVSGEFGEENFGRFMENAIDEKSIVKPETWKEAVKYLMNEKPCIEAINATMLNRTVPADVNENDYIYALENEEQGKPFRSKMNRKIEPSMIIPGVISRDEEEETVEDNSTEDGKDEEAFEKEAVEENEVKSEEDNQEENTEEDSEGKENSDEEAAESEEEDEEAELALNRRREQLIEREKLEKEKEEERQRKIEEEEKKKDPVERAKKGIEELKSEIEGDLEEPSYEEESDKEKSDLEIISDIVGLKDEMEDDEEDENEDEEEPKKKGFSLFGGRKNKEEEQETLEEEPSDEEESEDDDEEEEYEADPEEIKEYEKKVKEIKEKKAEDKKKRRKLDMIIAILIVAVAAGGYGLTVKRQKQQERIKQEQIKQEQQEEARKEAEEKRKEEEEKKIAEEESARLAEMEKVKSGGEYYKVYAGAFKQQDKADSLIINLKKKGFNGELVHIGNYYKAVVGGDIGAYPEAEKQMKALKAKGFDSYIEKYDKYCDLKIEDFRLKAEYMNKDEIESAYKDLNNELKKRKNYEDYSKILERTYEELINAK